MSSETSVKTDKNTATIEGFEGLSGKIKLNISVDGSERLEQFRDKLFADMVRNPKKYASTISRFYDYVNYCRIYADRLTGAIELRHFSELTDEKIAEASGCSIEELEEIDQKFWPEIKQEILEERELTEEEFDEIGKNYYKLFTGVEKLDAMLREWYNDPTE